MSEESVKVDVYVAEKKVEDVSPSEAVTPMKDVIYDITFEDDTKIQLTRAKFQAIQTLEKSDSTIARQALVKEIGSKVYAILCEYGVLMSEVDPTLNEVVRLANDNQNHALDILWGKQHYERGLLDVNAVLLTKYDPATQQEVDPTPAPAPEEAPAEADDDDGATPQGDGSDTADTKEV